MSGLVIVIVMLLSLSACVVNQPHGGGPVQAGQPVVRLGDSWSYSVTNGFNHLQKAVLTWNIAALNGSRIEADIDDGSHSSASGAVYAGPWNTISRVLPVSSGFTYGNRFTFSPPLMSFAFPLHPGQSWRQDTNATELASGHVFHWRITTKVYGWGRVKTAAGEFDTLKIVRYLNLGDDTAFRTETRRIETEWYAPNVKAIVRRETQGEYFLRQQFDPRRLIDRENWELTAYTLK